MKRLLLEVEESRVDWAARYAAYRNAMAKAQDKTLRRKWSTKAICEQELSYALDGRMEEMADMIEALGPLPSAADTPEAEAERLKYAREVLKWDRKHSAK